MSSVRAPEYFAPELRDWLNDMVDSALAKKPDRQQCVFMFKCTPGIARTVAEKLELLDIHASVSVEIEVDATEYEIASIKREIVSSGATGRRFRRIGKISKGTYCGKNVHET